MGYMTQLWMGPADSYYEYRSLLDQAYKMYEGKSPELKALLSDDDEEPSEYESPLLSRVENVGVVKVHGPIGARASFFSRIFGIPTHDLIYDSMIEAASDSAIEHIVMDMATPGGAVEGFSRSLEGIREAKQVKPVHVYGSGSILSAGLWMASEANSTTLDGMSEIGSLGVIGIVQNMAEAMKKQGVETTVVRSAKGKAPITPYEKLSDVGMQSLRKSVDQKFNQFIQGVASARGLDPEYVRESIGTGEVYSAQEGIRLGIADKIQGYNEFFRGLLDSESDAQSTYAGRHSLAAGSLAAEVPVSTTIITGIDMKNKPTEAQATVSAEDRARAAAAEGITITPEELKASAAEAQATEGEETQKAAESQETLEASQEPAEGGESPAAKDTVSISSTLTEKYVAAVEELASLKAEHSILKAEAATKEASMQQFMKITADSINRMNITLGASSQDLSSLTAGNLLELHSTTYSKVMARFPAGQQSEQDDGTEVEKAVQSFSEQHAHLTTPIRKVK